MPRIRSLPLVAAALVLAAGRAPAQDLPPATELIQRFERASGFTGLTARDHGHLVYETSVMGMTMRMEQHWAGADRMRATMSMPLGDAMVFGRNGDVYWIIDPDQGPRRMTEEETHDQRGATSVGGNLLAMTPIRSAETLERTEVEGVPCYRVKVVDTFGVESEHCLAVDGGLLVSSTLWGQARSGGSKTTVLLLDYRDVGRFKVPGRMVVRVHGQEVVSTLVHADAEPQPDSLFEIPEALRDR